jgi:hypothetical protein
MQMDLFYAGKQGNNNYTERGNLEGVHGQRVSAEWHALISAVKPGCVTFFGSSTMMVITQ